MKGKVNCTCGWSWNKSDSSAKDMYICHECGRDNSNNMKNGGWLDNYNDSQASAPEGMVGDGFSNVGRNYSPAWGGQFQMGGSLPGAVGFTYARTNDPAPSEGPYAKKTLPSAQVGKKIKIKDERGQVMKSAESTGVKRKNFDIEQSRESKAYIDAVAAQKKEAARRAKLTKDQREREDYNAYAQEHGNISKYTPETTWQRTKAIVSNPMTAAGYVARGENLPGRFQYGPRNEHDYALDWINPLQGAASLSEIPGELGKGEFLNAGLSALDALDLGAYARGAKKLGGNQLRNLSPAIGYREGGIIDSDRGQWDHPGEVTRINSNEITMEPDPKTGKPLTKPLLGISDTGDVKLMRPGGNYKFDGKRVTEYPVAQDGKTFLDELKANTAAKKNKVNVRETPPAVVNDNIANASKMAAKADEARVKDARHSNRIAAEKAKAQRDAQRQFNALSKEEQERVLYEQYARENGTISQYEPDSILETIGNVAVAPMSALKAKMETGRVPDNLVKGLIENPDQINPLDAAYLGTLGYLAAPTIASGVGSVASAAAPYMAADAVVGGSTLTGVNLNNLLTAGFATHGLMNAAPDVAEWIEKPSWEKAGEVGMDALEIAPIAGPAAKMISEGAGYVGNKANQASSYIGETAPKVKNFIKDATEDVKGVYNQYKQINEIKNSKSNPKSLFNTAERINTDNKYYVNQFNSITQPQEFNGVADDLMWDFEQKLIRMGGKDFADVEMNKWKTSLQRNNPKLFLEVKEMENGRNVPTADELKRIGRELTESLPKGEDIIPSAKKHLSNVQKQILFDKKKDFETLKEFTKNIGVKTPKVPKVEYTPKEQETIAAIRELGKYKQVAQYQKNKLLADPEALANINKEILKLDDDVVQDLIGISKSELLDSYKNVVPTTKKTQVDITSNPIPVSDLSVVDQQNTIQPGMPEEMHPLNEKQFRAIDPKRESLLQRIEQSYAKNFAPIDYQKPTSYPKSLISMAKTDYTYQPLYDASGHAIPDAFGNQTYSNKLTSQGQVKQQLIGALKTVEASPKGTNFIGSGSLSTDSYPLTLDSGKVMLKKGLVEVNVEPGVTGLNGMGYTNMSPRLAIKDINSKIEELEKLSGKKLPRAKYNPSGHGTYDMYQVPRIYFTRLKQGGSINTADENSLVKLDQLTNFTNYNKPQPGGWLNKYN